MSEDANNIEQAAKKAGRKRIKRTTGKKAAKQPCQYLSSGSTLLNLACTNNPFGAFPKGKYTYFVGDSKAGKTFLSMSCFAEATVSEVFSKYRFIYDNVEDGMLMNLEELFNKKVAEKMEPPAVGHYEEKRGKTVFVPNENGDPAHSFTIEEFYYNVHNASNKAKETGVPFIYVLDSMDGLSSEAEADKFDEQKKAYEAGKETAGSYGDGKAKKNSSGIRQLLKGLRDTGSILIIISQTRDNLGFGHKKKTRSGGNAPTFYATLELWASNMGKHQKQVRGKKRTIGGQSKVKIEKNRITGELHEVLMDIYPSYGIDDIGSCIDYLVSEKWWSKSGNTINADEFDMKCSRDKLIRHIEDENLHRKLKLVTGRCWKEIGDEKKLVRRKKYED